MLDITRPIAVVVGCPVLAEGKFMDEHPAYFVKSVEKTFDVLRAFSPDTPRLTVSQIAAQADLTRASARRFLLTLVDLGYLRTDGTHFELTARTLEIGSTFIAGQSLPGVAELHLKSLASELGETASLCVLDGTDVVYIACVPSPRILNVSISVGTRFPAWATSMGRVLLSALPPQKLDAYYESVQLQRFTEQSIGSLDALRAEIQQARKQGWAMVSQELEDGLRGVAVPVWSGDKAVAAVNVSLQTNRSAPEVIEQDVVPLLQKTAHEIGLDYTGRTAHRFSTAS